MNIWNRAMGREGDGVKSRYPYLLFASPYLPIPLTPYLSTLTNCEERYDIQGCHSYDQ
jgi:hypothetical protein